MRIKWLDAELTEALLIRGFWFWKRIAPIRRLAPTEIATRPPGQTHYWVFSYSELPVVTMDWELEQQRDWQLRNGLDEVDWTKAREMPTVIGRKRKPTMRLMP